MGITQLAGKSLGQFATGSPMGHASLPGVIWQYVQPAIVSAIAITIVRNAVLSLQGTEM
jgi:hypothetical protein